MTRQRRCAECKAPLDGKAILGHCSSCVEAAVYGYPQAKANADRRLEVLGRVAFAIDRDRVDALRLNDALREVRKILRAEGVIR